MTGTAALAGLRVVDLSTLFAAPQVAALLADLGADVVKVEPPAGDPLQGLGFQRGGRSAPYRLANRGKRRVVVDPDTDEGRAALAELTARAASSSATSRARSSSGGAAPPRRSSSATPARSSSPSPATARPGPGPIVRATALSRRRSPASPTSPARATGRRCSAPSCSVTHWSRSAGAFGALAACWHRDAGGGRGQHVDVSMYEPIVALLGPAVVAWAPGEPPPVRTGSRVPGGVPRNVYRASDGRYVVLSGTTDAQVARVLAVIGRDTPDDHA